MLIFLNLHNSEPEKANMTAQLIEGLVMNLVMKIMMLQFMLKGPRPCTILCFNVHTPAEYINGDISFGQLLQHITKAKNADKNRKQRRLLDFRSIPLY